MAVFVMTGPVFFLVASPGRELRVLSPALVTIVGFLLSCVSAGVPDSKHSLVLSWFPSVWWLLSMVLIVPATRALDKKYRWLGLAHALTVLASSYLWLFSSVYIGRDGL